MQSNDFISRRLHGRRGLKSLISPLFSYSESRRLHGRRGLKCNLFEGYSVRVLSPPSRAAWIEILGLYKVADSVHVAAFTGGVD